MRPQFPPFANCAKDGAPTIWLRQRRQSPGHPPSHQKKIAFLAVCLVFFPHSFLRLCHPVQHDDEGLGGGRDGIDEEALAIGSDVPVEKIQRGVVV